MSRQARCKGCGSMLFASQSFTRSNVRERCADALKRLDAVKGGDSANAYQAIGYSMAIFQAIDSLAAGLCFNCYEQLPKPPPAT